MREPYFFDNNLDEVLKTKPLSTPALKDLSLTGNYYTNSVNSDDLFNSTYLTSELDFNLVPLMSTLFTAEDSYEN
jgi:hypothetical protein